MKERKYVGLLLVNSIANAIPSIAVPYILMRLLKEDWGFFWILLAAIYLLYFTVWLLRGALNYVFYHLLWKSFKVDGVYEVLVENSFPNPDDYWPRYASGECKLASYYYENIVNDDSLECSLRIKAAAFVVADKNALSDGRYLDAWRMVKVHEEALAKYKRLHFDQRPANSFGTSGG